MAEPSPEEMAVSLCATMRANVDNDKLDDASFREFVRNSLPLTEPNGEMTKEARLFLALRMACDWAGIRLVGTPNTVMSMGIQELVHTGYGDRARKAEDLAQQRKNENERNRWRAPTS